MYFSIASALAIAASLLPVANAVNAVGLPTTVSCSSDNLFVCTNLAANTCCGSYPTGYGYSVVFEGLPLGTQGQGYSNTGCSGWLFTLFGSGTKCWNGGGTRARTTKWFYSSARRALKEGDDEANCVAPDEFRYTTADGVQHIVKIPAGEGEAQKIADLHSAKNFKALSALEAA